MQGSSFDDETLYEDFMIPSSNEMFRINKIVCIIDFKPYYQRTLTYTEHILN